MRIVADEKIPFLRGVLDPYAEVEYLPPEEITSETLFDADALMVRSRTRCDSLLFEGAGIVFLTSATSGKDHIVTEFCRNNNIIWHHAKGCNAEAVAQYVVAAILKYAVNEKLSLEGKVLGIIGVGCIGSKVERLAKFLGLEVLLNDPPRAENENTGAFVTLDDVLTKSDIITLHVQLDKESKYPTFHLIGEEQMSQMKSNVLLINTSRGEVVDGLSLKPFFRQPGRQAALDVFESEPNVDPSLLERTLIATPHIAGYSVESKARCTAESVRALSKFFRFGLDDWYPELDPPSDKVLNYKRTGDIYVDLNNLIGQTYDLFEVSEKLRSEPGKFEWLRGNLALRREFQAYDVRSDIEEKPIEEAITGLGFKIKENN